MRRRTTPEPSRSVLLVFAVSPGPRLSIAKYLPICFLAKADQQRIAQTQCWCFQVAARAEKVRGQCLIVGRIIHHIEDGDFFAACRNHALHRMGQLQRLGAAVSVLRRIHNRAGHFHIVGRKEPLRFLATGSTAAMIHPFDIF
jgi:hypothetical protein